MDTATKEKPGLVSIRVLTLVTIILLAAVTRLVPHPWNFTPVTAMALFGGAYFSRKSVAFAVPLAAMVLSDLVLGHTRYGFSTFFFLILPFGYACFVLTVWLGLWIQQRHSVFRIGLCALGASTLHFLVTNFGFWLLGLWLPNPHYPLDLGGLLDCYIGGLAFFRNTLAGDGLYTFILFGGFALAQRYVAALREDALWTGSSLVGPDGNLPGPGNESFEPVAELSEG